MAFKIFFLIFVIFFYFSWKAEKKKEYKGEKSSICSVIPQKRAVAKAGAGLSQEPGIQPEPPTWVFTCCLSRSALTRSWNWKWSEDLTPGSRSWEAGVPSRDFLKTRVPFNSVFCRFLQCPYMIGVFAKCKEWAYWERRIEGCAGLEWEEDKRKFPAWDSELILPSLCFPIHSNLFKLNIYQHLGLIIPGTYILGLSLKWAIQTSGIN